MHSYRMNNKSLELCTFLELSNSQLHLGKWFLSGEDSISSSVKWLWKWHHRECWGNNWYLSRHQAQSPPMGNTEYILTQLFNYSVLQLPLSHSHCLIPSSQANLLSDLEQMSLPLCTSTLSSMSHSGVLNVFWSPCRFCLISRDSWGNARGQGRGLPPEQCSPRVFWLCTSVWHLTWTKISGSLQKVCQSLVRSKGLSRSNSFQSRSSWLILPAHRS